MIFYTSDLDKKFKISLNISSHLNSGPSLRDLLLRPLLGDQGSVRKLLVYLFIYFHRCLHMIPSISLSAPPVTFQTDSGFSVLVLRTDSSADILKSKPV